MVEHLFDILVSVLLLVTIVHLAMVQRRLRAFRAERDRLQAFVTALDLTVERAEAAIRRMREIEAAASPPSFETAPPSSPRTVRNRSPEELLRAARAAAGVSSAKPREGVKGRGPKSAETLADALQGALGG